MKANCRYGICAVAITFFMTACLAANSTLAGTCSEGTGIPPFLSAGADPNLLLVVDNSGSMLDMAYLDKNNQCFDDTYTADSTTLYAGNFESEANNYRWYKWNDASLPSGIEQWTSGECYKDGELVLNGGVLYESSCLTPSCPADSSAPAVIDGCPASGNNVGEDNEDGGVIWKTYIQYDTWQNNTPYSTNDFVKYQSNLYRAENTNTSSGTSPIDDIGVSWVIAEHTWLVNHSYSNGDIVTYKGMLFQTDQNFTSSGTGLFDDRVGGVPTGELLWDRIDEGYFEQLSYVYSPSATSTPPAASDLCADYSYAATYTDSFGQVVTDIAIRLVDSSGNKITNVADPTQIPANVTCFAASGNFLNWAAASKFDIEKKILTGGKYHAGYENKSADGSIDNTITTDSDDDRIVSEHRGCAGLGFTKQVSLAAGSDGSYGTADDIKLTLRIRGSNTEDWIDTTDNTTRLEILAVTEGGYDNQACQAVVDAIIAGASFNSISNLINTCLAGASDDERVALNHGLQYCEALRSKDTDRDLNTLIGDCVSIYTPATGDISPATIQSEQGSYMCAGVFKDTLLHSDREGYMGRCWTVPSSLTCWQKACSQACTTAPCYYEIGTVGYMCAVDGFEYVCDGNFNAIQETCNKPWVAVYEGPDALGNLGPCTPSGGDTAGWSDDTDGVPGGPDGTFADGACKYGILSEGVDCECIGQAMHDYCQDMAVPEVIDPSDIASSTIDYLGLPGNLVDSGVMSQLGIENPLVTYKNYIKYEPDANDAVERPEGPRGVLYDVAPDLRLGVMAFTDNGSKAECELLQSTCRDSDDNGIADVCEAPLGDPDSVNCAYCNERQSISKFCPDSNGDGARILSNIEVGMYVDEGVLIDDTDDFEVWDHYSSVVTAINNTRATSWTPLAESVYTALGYFSQDTSRRLNDVVVDTSYDFQVESEVNSYVSGKTYGKGVIVQDSGGKYFQTVTGGISAGADPLHDPGLGWTEITSIDPVQFWCQDNHILIITEGASTADINQQVIDFVDDAAANLTIADTDAGADATCDDGLDGSTYLDDLTYFLKIPESLKLEAETDSAKMTEWEGRAKAIYGDPGYLKDGEKKQDIFTHIVTTGSLRTDGNGECSPETIMNNAADNGGTSLYSGEDPAKLESNLRQALLAILGRASAGSAASVISSSRSGEGAIYQAIFWPRHFRDVGDALTWVGDVHALFVDSAGRVWDDFSLNADSALDDANEKGRMWSEDTNGDGWCDKVAEDLNKNGYCDGDRRIVTYFDPISNTTKVCFNESVIDGGTCETVHPPDSATYYDTLAPIELKEFHDYLWSVQDQLAALYNPTNLSSELELNRELEPINHTWDFTTNSRFLFTWDDLDNDGIVDGDLNYDGIFNASDDDNNNVNEIIELTHPVDGSRDAFWQALNPGSNALVKHDAILDFCNSPTNDDLRDFITWYRGGNISEDTAPFNGVLDVGEDLNNNGILDFKFRCRRYGTCDQNDSGFNDFVNNPPWLIGDVIHSTPMVVASPAEAFHYIYRDGSYGDFAAFYSHRRHVVYFGGNDGMLHAVNGGFFDQDENKFYPCRPNGSPLPDQRQSDGSCIQSTPYTGSFAEAYPALGDELWAYTPYNLLPHVRSLSDPDYEHKYYVDAPPRIFDAKVFEEEADCAANGPGCIHKGGWGTLLIGYMRFGGYPLTATEVSGDVNDARKFISSYFILDVTDPERPPRLLAEMTATMQDDGSGNLLRDATGRPNVDANSRLGFTTPMPTSIIMRDSSGHAKWYLVLGNGPTTMKGENDQQGKLAIIPFEWLVGEMTFPNNYPQEAPTIDVTKRKAFRIPLGAPSGTDYTTWGGVIPVPIDPNTGEGANSYISDIVAVDYDIEGQTFLHDNSMAYKADAVYFGTVDGSTFTGLPGYTRWGGGGRLFRMVTKKLTTPDPLDPLKMVENMTNPADWATDSDLGMKMLLDAKAPITAAPTIGYDSENFWVYFGTGRFFDKKDKTDDTTNYFFGIKEPLSCGQPPCDCGRQCGASGFRMTWDTVEWDGTPMDPDMPAGQRGLFKADHVNVVNRASSTLASGEPYLKFYGTQGIDYTIPTGLDATNDPKYSFEDLRRYIVGEGCWLDTSCLVGDNTAIHNGIDGWYRKLVDPRERNIGQAALLGGLATFATYQPYDDLCKAEGLSYLYGVHYQTGTAWYEDVFGTSGGSDDIVYDRLDLGTGMTTTPSIHVGSDGDHDAKAFVQTSTGEIKEIIQDSLPLENVSSGKTSWSDQCP